MEISKFVNITFVNYNNLYIVKLVVNHSVPTSLQWIFFTSELKNIITDLKNKNIKFGFLFDIKNLGMISLTYIKEFTEIMTSNSIVLEQNLYATSAIAEGVVIKYIFEIINRIYTTKKPLNIFNNEIDALKFIEENKY
jgi:hypothetical protein